MEHPASHVESHWRTQLRNRIIQASSLLEGGEAAGEETEEA